MAKRPQKKEDSGQNQEPQTNEGVPAINDQEQLKEELSRIGIRGDKAQKVSQLVMTRIHHHSGPLPDIPTLNGYNELIPNGAERVMKMAENQAEHRMHLEKMGLRRSFNQGSTGQWMGFSIAILFFLTSVYLIFSGFTVSGTILGTVDLVALVTVFVTRRIYNQK